MAPKTTKKARPLYTGPVFKILYNTWGYEQTNVDFFLVITETDKSALLLKLDSVDASHNAESMTGRALPDLSRVPTTLETYRAVIRTNRQGQPEYRSSLGLSRTQYPAVWEGHPVSYSFYG